MSLARETGRGEKASMFHDMRESFCVQKVSMLRNLCVTWLCMFRKGMGSQLRVDRLKAERVRQSLLVTMGRMGGKGGRRRGWGGVGWGGGSGGQDRYPFPYFLPLLYSLERGKLLAGVYVSSVEVRLVNRWKFSILMQMEESLS